MALRNWFAWIGGSTVTLKIDRESEPKEMKRGERELATLRPSFRREVVERIVKRLFPEHQVHEIWQILNDCQRDSEEFTSRIHLDALKLSDGSVESLRQHIHSAKQDFRDVVMPSECPRLHALGVVAYERLSEDEKDRLTNADLQDYLDWLKEV